MRPGRFVSGVPAAFATLPHPARRFASIRIIRGQVLYDFVSIHFH
jgi:hypothetical protein